MNKNIIIGLLGGIIVILGVLFFIFGGNIKDQGDNALPADDSSTTDPLVGTTPQAPTVKTSVDYSASISTAMVNGKVRPNGAATTYWFEYGETASLGNKTILQDIGSGFSLVSTPAYIMGLKANTTYYFRLSAKNRFATVNGATYTLTTNYTPVPSGSMPTSHTLSATDIFNTSANLRGQINPNQAETNYWFEYGKDINFGRSTVLQRLAGGNTTVSVSSSISGLSPSTKYYFRLNAQNQYGTVNGTILNFTTAGPVVPSAPSVNTNSASSVTTTSVTFNGSINPNNAETTYWFEYSENSSLSSLIGSSSSQLLAGGNSNMSVSTNITGLNRGTRYYYRLMGRNQYGTVAGDIVSFRTKN
ncbi:MAG: hypothetical protein WC870_00290 [Candidatus Paceibacterota bacterium]